MNRPVSNTVLVSCVGLVAIVIICITGLAALGREITQIIIPITTVLSGVVPVLLLVLKQDKISDKVDDLNTKTERVVHQTNGRLDSRFDDVKADVGDLHAKVDELLAAQPKADQ